MKKQLLCLLSLCIALNTATAKITLPTVLNSNMVLQRECNANLWGTASPSKKVTVTPSWNNKKYTVTADAQGAWKLAVETPKAGGPYSIRISDGEAIELTNILIGEVWICSGQSNMQMPVKGFTGQPAANAIKTLLQCNNPSIRLFTVKREAQAEPQQDCHSKQGWQEAFPESVGDFSAIGYYFGRTLQQMLGIPIGMIESDWGGTRIESWMTTSAILKTEPDGLNREDRFQGQDQNRASYLYNAMIYPIVNYTARGFLWYQGESNLILGNTPYYARHMQQMVALWREMWGNNEMPFYYVQIAPYIYISTDHTAVPMIVEQQVQALDLIPYSGMAPTLDIGETHCIHPSQKEEVGERLAMLALKKDYGIHGISCEAPRMKEVRFEGGKAIVTFTGDRELGPDYRPIQGFEIAGADKVFIPARAVFGSSLWEVVVSSEIVPEPVAVRYGFRNVPKATSLTSTTGLPAFPFRSDNWDDAR